MVTVKPCEGQEPGTLVFSAEIAVPENMEPDDLNPIIDNLSKRLRAYKRHLPEQLDYFNCLIKKYPPLAADHKTFLQINQANLVVDKGVTAMRTASGCMSEDECATRYNQLVGALDAHRDDVLRSQSMIASDTRKADAIVKILNKRISQLDKRIVPLRRRINRLNGAADTASGQLDDAMLVEHEQIAAKTLMIVISLAVCVGIYTNWRSITRY